MKLAPGSVAWLVAFDLRFALQRFGRTLCFGRADLSWPRVIRETWIMLLLLHVLALLVVLGVRFARIPENYQLLILSVVILVVWIVMLGSAVYFATALLFIRGDMELLLSSPIAMRNVLGARAISIGLQACFGPAIFCLPAANIALLFGDPRWLAAYPVMLALGLSAAAAGLLLTIALVRIFGPRRARAIAVLASALFGACWILAFQLPAMLGNARIKRMSADIGSAVKASALQGSRGLWWYPAQAVQGDLLPLIVMLLAGFGFFWLVLRFLPRGFLFAMQRAADASTSRRLRAAARLRFHAQFGVTVFLKEWRLVLRDPWLLGRLGRMLIIAAVVVVAMWLNPDLRRAATGNGLALASAYAVIFALGLADTLVWLAVCAEDLPDLVSSAPRSAFQLLRLKLFAMLLPLWLVALCGALLLAQLSVSSALWLMIAIVCGSLSAGLVHLLHPVRASRTDIMRRMRSTQGMPLERVALSMLNMFGWAGVAYCFPAGHWLAGLIVLAIVGTLTATRVAHDWRFRWTRQPAI